MERMGKGKGKDKGRGKGRPRNAFSDRHRTQTKMTAWERNSGFRSFWTSNWISEINGFDIDVTQQSLWLVPLSRLPSTNPVYAHPPGQGEYEKILHDLSESPDHEGIYTIGSLDDGSIGQRDFVFAKVELASGEEGYINVAMHRRTWPHGRWLMYFKVVLINDPGF